MRITSIKFKNCTKIKKFQNVIFLGTGGSSLGGKTLVSLKKIFTQMI